MNKSKSFLLVLFATGAICAGRALAATWEFHPDFEYFSPQWGEYNGNGWLTVWGTQYCDPIGPPLFEDYVLRCQTYSGPLDSNFPYNDFELDFAWDYGCGNRNKLKIYACVEMEPLPLNEWMASELREPTTLPSLGDPTGTDPNLYVTVNLARWLADPRPLQETYEIVHGQSPDLPGFRVATTPFAYEPGEYCHPFASERLFTGVLWRHAEIRLIPDNGVGGAPTPIGPPGPLAASPVSLYWLWTDEEAIISWSCPDGYTYRLDPRSARKGNWLKTFDTQGLPVMAYRYTSSGDGTLVVSLEGAPSKAATLLHFEDDVPRKYYYATDSGNDNPLNRWAFILRAEGMSRSPMPAWTSLYVMTVTP